MKTAGTVFQTYRQEVADHFNELDEANRRLVVMGDIKQWNQMLAETAHKMCIRDRGCVRRTIHIALKDMGINRPYPLEGGVDNEERSASRKRADNRVQELSLIHI